MNSTRAKRKSQQTIVKLHNEVPAPQPIDTDLAVLLLPINVRELFIKLPMVSSLILLSSG